MIGILVAAGISWMLLFLFEKKSILALGWLPIGKRAIQFLTGFLITGVLCCVVLYLEACLKEFAWVLNQDIATTTIIKSFWWDLRSVLTEELIFRGALLYILIQKIGVQKSILISAIAFGIYHWFSFGVIGNVMAMFLVFIGTGLMGYAWAWAFAKTKSIMLPLGLHLGWNFVHNTIFSKGPKGELVLMPHGGIELTGWMSLFNFVIGLIIVPMIVLMYVKYFVGDDAEINSVSSKIE